MPYVDKEKRKEVQRRYDEKRRGKRSRSWACIVYPESAPEEWIEKLNEEHVPALISPLHDRDVTAEGELKKAHYHVMIIREQPVSGEQARAIFEKIGVKMSPELVKSVKGYARYLVHKDDHDKHQYDETEVKELSGANWKAMALDKEEEIDFVLTEIEDFIDDNNVLSYRQLCRYARMERPDWIHVIRTHTYHLTSYVKSAVWELTQAQK